MSPLLERQAPPVMEGHRHHEPTVLLQQPQLHRPFQAQLVATLRGPAKLQIHLRECRQCWK
eukprot:14238340-Alexandrium_andersonii.AAC.1